MVDTSARRILFIGMLDSPHAAKWIQLVADQGWDLHFFPVDLVKPHRLLSNITVHLPWKRIYPRQWLLKQLRRLFRSNVKVAECYTTPAHVRSIFPLYLMSPFDRILVHPKLSTSRLGESDVRAPWVLGPRALKKVIKKVKPDLIHSMEFQHAGYLALRTKESMGRDFPAWLATNWGSDIFYYQRFDDHRQQITRLLKNIDYYSCECERDIGLAHALGMTAKVLPVLPNTGGFDIEAITTLRGVTLTSQRKIVMVKGYQHFAGRALTALKAIAQCAPQLQGYEIVVFSARGVVVEKAQQLQQETGITFTVLPYTDHDTMLDYFSRARIYLGVSISDAISTSMLEAMAMGAFPIQTDTACCEEWIEDGVTGFAVSPDDADDIAAHLNIALNDDAMVDAAALENWKVVQERLDQNILKLKEIAFYEQIFAGIAV